MSYNEFTYPKLNKSVLLDSDKKKLLTSNFPIVLAGPIIKRAEPDSIYLWVCTSEKLELGVKVYKGIPNLEKLNRDYQVYFDREKQNQQKDSFLTKITVPPIPSISDLKKAQPYSEIGQGFATGYTIGSKMFIHLLKVKPFKNNVFPRGLPLSYEIFVLQKNNSFTGAKLLLDKKERELITINDTSPVFSIQKDDKNDLRLAFGSCRKFHGDAKDCTISLFEQKYKNKKILDRPNALFLLGDQIYADDVSSFIIPKISYLDTFLVGMEELTINRIIQNYDNGKPKYLNKINATYLKVGKRKEIINDPASFTSTDCENHLATLGEFCAMYLLAYNGALWDSDSEMFKSIKDKARKLKPNEREELLQLLNAKKGSEAMRKILANTPTYMICDDHEITDDWNITNDWKKTVSNNQLGARIVTNGICAYWFFQFLGNDPDNEENGKVIKSTYFEKLVKSRFDGSSFIADKVTIENCTKHLNWTFIAPTIPATLFLDTRFNRKNTKKQLVIIKGENKGNGFIEYKDVTIDIPYYKYDDVNSYAPSLINIDQIEFIKTLLININAKGIIIATPAPVFGLIPIEDLIETKFKQGDKTSFMDNEREAWSCNPYGIDNFIKLLSELYPDGLLKSKIRILSGDVHYSFYNKVVLNMKNKKNDIEIDMLTASGIKNPPEKKPFADIPVNISGKINSFHIERKKGKENEPITLVISEVPDQVLEDYNYTSEMKILPITKLGKPINEYMWKDGSFGFLNGDKNEFIVP